MAIFDDDISALVNENLVASYDYIVVVDINDAIAPIIDDEVSVQVNRWRSGGRIVFNVDQPVFFVAGVKLRIG